MSNMRIRNMFLLVTALAVMFLLACGQSDEERVEPLVEVTQRIPNELAITNCDELAQVFLAGGGVYPSGTASSLTRLVVGSVRTNLNNNDVMRCSAKGVFTFTTTTWSYTPPSHLQHKQIFGTSETLERKRSSSTVDKTIYMEYQKVPIKDKAYFSSQK